MFFTSSGRTSRKAVSVMALPYLLSYAACPKPLAIGMLAGKLLLDALDPRLLDSMPLPEYSLVREATAPSRLKAVFDMDFLREIRWAALMLGTDNE
jgi:hypothetical protein